MPVHSTIDRKRRTVFSVASGALTDEELIGASVELARDPDFDPGFNQLFDASEVSDLLVTGDGIRELATRVLFADGVRRAILVNGSTAAFGMGRMYAQLRDDAPEKTRVFRDREEALDWLGLSP